MRGRIARLKTYRCTTRYQAQRKAQGEMRMKQILVTGGAGFIGSHLVDELLEKGYRVRVIDNLASQVHGPDRKRPAYLNSDVELIVADVRNPEAVRRALLGVDAVFHFVAVVGVGQSMYELTH